MPFLPPNKQLQSTEGTLITAAIRCCYRSDDDLNCIVAVHDISRSDRVISCCLRTSFIFRVSRPFSDLVKLRPESINNAAVCRSR